MKRRGFLGFLGGAAVAGPSMAKQAVAATIADLNVAGLVGGIPTPDWGAPTGTMQGSYDHSWQIARLAKLALRTAAQHEWHRRRTGVHALDPDLAGYRSFALHFKIGMQRDRNYERSLAYDKTELEAQIAGWFD